MVRYADKPTVQVTIEIAAAPAAVWDLVTDINLPARFSSEFQGAEWIDTDGPRRGARFIGRNRHRAVGEWETTCTVVWFDPLRTFGYAVNDLANPAARWRFDLEPQGAATRLTMWAQLGPGRSGLTPFIEKYPEREEEIVSHRLDEWRSNIEITVAGIKAVAEGE